MAITALNRSRVDWTLAITGAFYSLAVGIVLWLFGAAFGEGGLGVLSGIWQVVTPLVATFFGCALVALRLDRADAYPTCIMVWCVSLVAATGLLAGARAFGSVATGNAAPLALAGLAAILGLVGATVGSAVGVAASKRLSIGSRGTAATDRTILESPPSVQPGSVVMPRPTSVGGEAQELKH